MSYISWMKLQGLFGKKGPAMVDIKQAYRMATIHYKDRPLLGMNWEGALFRLRHFRSDCAPPLRYSPPWRMLSSGW